MKKQGSVATIDMVLQAIDALTNIVEEEELLVHDKSVGVQKSPLYVLKVGNIAKNTFKLIYEYLKQYYKKEYGRLIRHESAESLKKMMSLVGESVRRLDGYLKMAKSHLSEIQQTKEFRQLTSFYKGKILPILTQESLEKWIKELPVKAVLDAVKHKTLEVEPPIDHLFIDSNSAKQDIEYELFYIKREDGSRFFTPRMIRHLKMECQYSAYAERDYILTPLNSLEHLEDQQAREKAQSILQGCRSELDAFLRIALKHKAHDYVLTLYNAIVALLLAAQEKPRIILKTATNYLSDCTKFLRALLISHEYQRIQDFVPELGPDAEEGIAVKVLHAVHAMMYALYTTQAVASVLPEYIAQECGHERTEPHLTARLAQCHKKMVKVALGNSLLPLIKTLTGMFDQGITGYDPLLLGNSPGAVYELPIGGKKVGIVRLPTPTYQEYINWASMNNEFKAFLRSAILKNQHFKCLVFNFQDRTSWKEYPRVKALEEVAGQLEFAPHLLNITFIKDGDFYHQTGPYQDISDSQTFIEYFIEQMQSESCGFSFPESLKNVLFPKLARKIATDIHKKFFSSRNVLPRTCRLDFIELTYLMFELAIIEYTHADIASFTCKDGLDLTLPAISLLYYFFNTISENHISPYDENYLKSLLFALPLIIRGRTIHEAPYVRMQSAMKVIELTLEELGIASLQKYLSLRYFK